MLLLFKLQAHRLLGELPAGVATPLTFGAGLAQQVCASIGNDMHRRGYLVVFILHHAHPLGVDNHSGQLGELIQTAVIAHAGMAVKLYLGKVARGARPRHKAHISKAARHLDVSVSHHVRRRGVIAYDIQRHGVGEVGLIGALHHS